MQRITKRRDSDEERNRIEELDREIRSRIRTAEATLDRFQANEQKILTLNELVSELTEAEAAVRAAQSDPALDMPRPPLAPPNNGVKKMDDLKQLEIIEKLAHDAGADVRKMRSSAEDLFAAVVKRYEVAGENPVRANYLAMKDEIGTRAYELVNEMTERELAIRSALGR